MKNRTAWLAGLCFVVLLAVACGLGWWLINGADPRVAHVEQLQQELATLGNDSDPQVRREKFAELRREMEALPDSQRQELRESMGQMFQQRMADQVHRFNQLAPAERTAFLDAEIDRMEKMRAAGGGRPGGPGRPPGSGRPTGMAGGPGGGGGPGQGGPRGPRSEEQRDARRRNRLDNSSPEQRAEFAVYIEAMRERRKARGLPDRGRR